MNEYHSITLFNFLRELIKKKATFDYDFFEKLYEGDCFRFFSEGFLLTF